MYQHCPTPCLNHSLTFFLTAKKIYTTKDQLAVSLFVLSLYFYVNIMLYPHLHMHHHVGLTSPHAVVLVLYVLKRTCFSFSAYQQYGMRLDALCSVTWPPLYVMTWPSVCTAVRHSAFVVIRLQVVPVCTVM